MKLTQTKFFKSRLEIAAEYGISRKTLYRKLKSKGVELPSGLLDKDAQQTIYSNLGQPKHAP